MPSIPSYWRHTASGGIGAVAAVDIDGDGHSEFALVAAEQRLEIVRGDGTELWDNRPVEIGEPIRAFTGYLNGVAVASSRVLRFVSTAGEIAWEVPLSTTARVEHMVVLPRIGQPDALLLQHANGALHLYEPFGNLLWTYVHVDPPAAAAGGLLAVADVDGDGQHEIVYSYSAARGFSRVDLISAEGDAIWTEALSHFNTSIDIGQFEAVGQQLIAIGNNLGELHLLDADGQSRWVPRTLNRPISDISFAQWTPSQALLVVSTTTGKLIGYTADGQRAWDKAVCQIGRQFSLHDVNCPTGEGSRVEVIDTPMQFQQAVGLAMVIDDGESHHVVTIDPTHHTTGHYQTAPILDQPLLIDSNQDGTSELLLTTFGSLDLLSAGTLARSTQEVGDPYSLAAEPVAFLAHDFNGDNVDDLILGGRDGRLHRFNLDEDDNAAQNWIVTSAGYTVFDMARLISPRTSIASMVGDRPIAQTHDDQIVVAYNQTNNADPVEAAAIVDTFRIDGSRVWVEPLAFESKISALQLVQQSDAGTLLLVGLENGRVAVFKLTFSAEGATSWQAVPQPAWNISLGDRIVDIAVLQQSDRTLSGVVVATDDEVRRFNLFGVMTTAIPADEPGGNCASTNDLLFLLKNGGFPDQPCLREQRLGNWLNRLGSSVNSAGSKTERYIYRPISRYTWQRNNIVDSSDGTSVLIAGNVATEFDDVQAFYTGDVTGDGLTDFLMGNSSGDVLLDLNESAESALSVSSAVRGITTLRSRVNAPANLAIISENSLVTFFSLRPNHAPLITTPQITIDNNQYAIQLSIIDIEEREIAVELETFDPESNSWSEPDRRTTSGKFSPIQWVFELPSHDEPLRYRISYTDGDDHIGELELPPGPPANSARGPLQYLPAVLAVILSIAVLTLFSAWMWQRPAVQAAYFYRRLVSSPSQILVRLRTKYDETAGDSELFVNVATQARQRGNEFVASLADGLYLLKERPTAGVPIIAAALEETEVAKLPNIEQSRVWQAMFGATNRFMNMPTITELSLIQPQLAQMLAINDEAAFGDMPKMQAAAGIEPFPRLASIFDSFRDSERVTTPEDRLVYLNDAESLLRRLELDMLDDSMSLSHALVAAIISRWQTLIATEMQGLRGRARLEAKLLTLRLAPTEQSLVTLELTNAGRATAEHINIELLNGIASARHGSHRSVPSLASHGTRRVDFGITLPEDAQFRVAFRITYQDRQQVEKSFEYANMVSVLTPQEQFEPVVNPYSPGTPLRRNSDLFFGRTPLFNFIAGEADRISQQHVLILVGQRRTGKTSALLRLAKHLPANLIPIYIDCQSLGVLPGMTAFFQDIAWLIADTLCDQDIDIEVPDLDSLGENPGKWFQSCFIPDVREHLLPDAKLVLVFDEFEAFENLTTDGILPRTIFSYMRHLMQHSEGLSFIFVGTHKLEEMTTDYWSVLFNIALYKEIDFLSSGATYDLITKPVEPNLIYDDLAINKIWRLTSGHPYFLQLVCYSLVKRANEQRTGYLTISDVNETVDEMLGLGEVHFAYIWQRSSSAERTVLIALAHLLDKELPFRPADLVDALEPYRNYVTPAEITAALNKLVQRNIIRTVSDGVQSLYELKVGLVGAWIERSKSLSTLYQEQLMPPM